MKLELRTDFQLLQVMQLEEPEKNLQEELDHAMEDLKDMSEIYDMMVEMVTSLAVPQNEEQSYEFDEDMDYIFESLDAVSQLTLKVRYELVDIIHAAYRFSASMANRNRCQ